MGFHNRKDIDVIIDKYYPLLLAYLWGRTNNKNLAEDLAQETWVRILNKDLSMIDNLRAYLFKVAKNLIIDFQRNSKWHIDIQQTSDLTVKSPDGSDTDFLFKDLQTYLFGHLNEEEHTIITLSLMGYTNKEIASRMSISSKTVANRKTIIRNKIKLAIK